LLLVANNGSNAAFRGICSGLASACMSVTGSEAQPLSFVRIASVCCLTQINPKGLYDFA